MPASAEQITADREQWRRTLLEVATALAPGWERHRARIEEAVAPVREWMVRGLAPRPGDTVLELAAGAGETGFDAAAMAGDRGRLLSTDVAPAMVGVARRRGAERGVANVDYRAMDAERIELEDDSVDGALCRFGFMLMADPAAALAETRRVLRPGGRLALAVWGAPERNPWISLLAGALVERGHAPLPDAATPSPFSLASHTTVVALLEAAGFASVRTEELPVRYVYADVEDYLRVGADTAGPAGLVLRGLSGPDRDAVAAHVGAASVAFASASASGLELPGVAVAALAS